MSKDTAIRQPKGKYEHLLTEISGIISHGRNMVLKQVNTAQVITYWLVGRRIVEFEQAGRSRADKDFRVIVSEIRNTG